MILARRDGSCPNYRPGDLDVPCEPDAAGYCLSCGYWAPLYPADRSRPVAVPQGVMRQIIEETGRLEAQVLRLAQGHRLLRDTSSEGSYAHNVAVSSLSEAAVPDPPDEDHP